MLLAVVASLFGLNGDALNVERGRPAAYPGGEPFISGLSDNGAPLFDEADRGPIVTQSAAPYVWNGDLRDLPQIGDNLPRLEMPRPGMFKDLVPTPPGTADPVAQTLQGAGQMPAPLMNFDGLHYGEYGGWHPPDTNGDVGPNHYIQSVNVGIGIFDKATGSRLVGISFDDFFQGPPGSVCDNGNDGDPIVNYDPIADRWIISDFALPAGESHQCFAVSQTGDPVSGGWYFYDIDTEDPVSGSWCDYPKIGVWPDAYYMTCNMFTPWIGANVFALDRTDMLIGDPVTVIMFRAGSDYGSLLPANVRGPLPPAGAPNYMLAVDFPDLLRLWEFHVDWAVPGNSSFTGPIDMNVAPFGYIGDIPQPAPGGGLDSLGDRLMFFLQYRNYGDHESLFVNHTVPSGVSAGVRWYEVRDPGGTPHVYQQGTFAPDEHYRWMGSIAADQDGNLAVGYSISSESVYPGIRYAGRLDGEILGLLPQGETSLIEGSGSQSGYSRWGDYSAMSVDPVDDCTFWYTQMYFPSTGGAWYTRIGSFKYPTCGQPKGWIDGTVYNADTLIPVAGAHVVGQGPSIVMTVETDANGHYLMPLIAGTFTVTAGPVLPGYPDPVTVTGVNVNTGATTTVDMALTPYPNLGYDSAIVDDSGAGGNGNGYPEPGETDLPLWVNIINSGATTATNVSAQITSLTPGVLVSADSSTYPDIDFGGSATNDTAFVFSVAPTVPCGARMDFVETLVTDRGTYTVPFSLRAAVVLPRTYLLTDTMESGPGNWTPGGTPNLWQITTETSHSPSHSWSDSPNGNYGNNLNTWLRSPVYDLSGQIGFVLDFWHTYNLEDGWDFAHVQYSTDGGSSWTTFPDAEYTGAQGWTQVTLNAAVLDDQPGAAFRFLMTSDTNTTEDGWHIDDVGLSYVPFACYYQGPAMPTLVAPPDGTVLTTTHDVTLTWEAGAGPVPDWYDLVLDGVTQTVTMTTYPTTLPAGPHTWQVRACNTAGCSDYTAAWAFDILDAPVAPVLLAPPDGTVTTTQAIEFTWQPSSTGGLPDGYNVDVDGTVYTETTTNLSLTLGFGDHTWSVRACNVAGCSDYTAAWMLTIVEPAGVPELLAPADGTVTTTTTLTFTWQAGPGGTPDGYNLELDGTVITTTAPLYTTTLAVGDHTWSVRAYNAAGYTAYSESWTVTVQEVHWVFLPLVLK